MKLLHAILSAPVFAAFLWAMPALAHPKLLSSSPAAKAVVGKTTRITLTFSEKLLTPMSGVDLTMTGMPGMATHAPMKIAGFKTAVLPDGKTLVVTLARPLAAAIYDLKWHAVAADTHRIQGAFSFTVK